MAALATALWLAAAFLVFGQSKENKGSEQEQKPQKKVAAKKAAKKAAPAKTATPQSDKS